MSCEDVISLLEKLRQEQQFVTFYKVHLRAGVQELNKSCDNVFHSLWITHTLTFALGRVLSGTVAGYEWSLALDQGVQFIDAAKVLQRHTHSYSTFLSSLLTDTRLLADVLIIADSDGLDSQWLLNDLMAVVFGHCLFQNDHAHYLRLLQELLRQHVNHCSTPQDLFSGSDSPFSKALTVYSSQLTELKAFLSELLSNTVMKVLAFDDYLEFDVGKAGRRFHSNADKSSGLVETATFLFSEDLDVSCGHLVALSMNIVMKLGDMSSQFPASIKWLVCCLKRAAKHKWDLTLDQERRLTADVVYGGIISSALVNPDTHAVIDPGLVVGSVARYNLTQVTAVLQRSAWSLDKDSVAKVVKDMDMEMYWSVLDGLEDAGMSDSLPELPLYLPGLKRSSFLASQAQLNNMVGLAASLLANRDGRGVFHSQMSSLLSSLPHILIDSAHTTPYTLTSLTPSHPHTTKKPRTKKRSSMARSAHTSVDVVPPPRSRSVGTTPPVEGSGFMLPTEVLILPFLDGGGSPSWDFHLLAEGEFMTPSSPTNEIVEQDSPPPPIAPPLQLSPAPTLLLHDATRHRSNTLPPPKSPGHVTNDGGGASWSPVKGAWLMAGLEEESPYDKLEAKEVYVASSDSSMATSPITPSTPSPTTPSLYSRDTPTLSTPIESTISDMEAPKNEATSQVNEPKIKFKKRKKFWPFRKHKADKRKARSQSEAANMVMETTPPKSRAHSEGLALDEPVMRNRRSYTLLTGHITAKYAALHARQRVAAETRAHTLLPKKVERYDHETPSSMSLEMFGRSLYCEQLKFKLRCALQNIPTPPASLNSECDTKQQLLLLIQQSLQHCRWQRDNMELSLLTELLTMIQPLPNQLVSVCVEGLMADYQKRSSYIAYLVKTHQRFQDAQLQVASLQSAVDRWRAVSCEVFVGHAVGQFLTSRDPQIRGLVEEMTSGLPADDKVSLMDAGQRSLAEAINNDSTWLCWNDMDDVMNRLDDHLFSHLYEHVFHPNGDSDTMRDQIFSQHLTRLSEAISITHKSLQIPMVYHSSCPWNSAQTHLKVMSTYKSPRGKVECVVTCCKVLISLLQLAKCGDPPGADDMFPVIVYVLLKANPPGLLSTVQYVKNFSEASLSGESAYWWAQFSTAVEFTKTLE